MPQTKPATPKALKLLKGERRDRVNDAEPVPTGEVGPTAPLFAEAQAVWDRLAPDLVRQGVLTAWDCDEFTAFCLVVGNSHVAWRDVVKRGSVLVEERTHNGGHSHKVTIKNPSWQVVKDCTDAMVKLGGRFGLTPSERSRLSVGGEGRDVNPAEAFLS